MCIQCDDAMNATLITCLHPSLGPDLGPLKETGRDSIEIELLSVRRARYVLIGRIQSHTIPRVTPRVRLSI